MATSGKGGKGRSGGRGSIRNLGVSSGITAPF